MTCNAMLFTHRISFNFASARLRLQGSFGRLWQMQLFNASADIYVCFDKSDVMTLVLICRPDEVGQVDSYVHVYSLKCVCAVAHSVH